MRRRIAVTTGIVFGFLVLGILFGIRFVPVAPFLEPVFDRLEEQNGWAVSVDDARLAWSSGGLALRATDPVARAVDDSQELEADRLDVHVPLGALWNRRLEARSWSLRDADYRRTAAAGTVRLEGIDVGGDLRHDGDAGRTVIGVDGEFARGAADFGTRSLPLPGADLAGRVVVEGDSTRRTVTVDSLRADRGPLHARLSGTYVWPAGTYDFRGSLQEADLADVIPLLPGDDRERLDPYAPTGRVAVPSFHVTESARAWTVVLDAFGADLPGGARLRDAAVRAEGDAGGITFSGTGRLADEPVEVSGAWSADPVPDLDVELETDVRLLGLLAPRPDMAWAGGRLLADVSLGGDLPWTAAAPPAVAGTVRWSDVSGTVRGHELSGAGGRARLDDRTVTVEEFAARVDGFDVSGSGSADWPEQGERAARVTLTTDARLLDRLAPRETVHWGGGTLRADVTLRGPGPWSAESLPAITGTVGWNRLDAVVQGRELAGASGRAVLDGDTVNLEEFRGRLAGIDLAGSARARREGEAWTAQYRAQAFGGELTGTLDAEPADGAWEYRVRGEGSVRPGDLVRTWWSSAPGVEGTTRLTYDLSGASGAERPLGDGSLEIRLTDGALRNLPGLASLARQLGVAGATADRFPIADGRARLDLRDGAVVVDTVGVKQAGVTWSLGGRYEPGGGFDLGGTARLDPSRVTLPAAVRPFVSLVQEEGGWIPVPFRVTGAVNDPAVVLDWDALVARAGERAKEEQRRELERKLEETIDDEDVLDRLRKKLGGG